MTISAMALMGVGFAADAAADPADRPDILFVFDASQSMGQSLRMDAQTGADRANDPTLVTKSAVAQSALEALIDEREAEARLGLMVYGATAEDDCEDITLQSDLSADASALKASLRNALPKGMSPIDLALQRAIKTLAKSAHPRAQKSVVLLSDGIETCGGDPCAVARRARTSGVAMKIHVVGLDVDPEARAQLACIAEAGGGQYADARNADQIGEGLSSVVARALNDREPNSAAAPTGATTPVAGEGGLPGESTTEQNTKSSTSNVSSSVSGSYEEETSTTAGEQQSAAKQSPPNNAAPPGAESGKPNANQSGGSDQNNGADESNSANESPTPSSLFPPQSPNAVDQPAKAQSESSLSIATTESAYFLERFDEERLGPQWRVDLSVPQSNPAKGELTAQPDPTNTSEVQGLPAPQLSVAGATPPGDWTLEANVIFTWPPMENVPGESFEQLMVGVQGTSAAYAVATLTRNGGQAPICELSVSLETIRPARRQSTSAAIFSLPCSEAIRAPGSQNLFALSLTRSGEDFTAALSRRAPDGGRMIRETAPLRLLRAPNDLAIRAVAARRRQSVFKIKSVVVRED
ncbi:MAG: VWA domain-containing protein [Pseudomonadota bacterium]